MRIGSFEVLPVIDGAMKVAPSAAFAGTTDADWAPHRDLLDADGQLSMTLGGFLIRGGEGGRVVLVDAGLGSFEMMGRKLGGQLMESLAAHGVKATDITDVIFSHLHLDHVGWASEGGKAAFPNATYRCDQRDWDYWVEGPEDAIKGVPVEFAAMQKQALVPIADRLATWSSDGTVLPGMNVMHTPGHTPGSASLVLSSGDARAMLLGDAVHCPVELVESEWGGLGDVDPELAKRTKAQLARELEGKDIPVSAAHFPGLSFGRVLKGGGKRRWVGAE